MTCPICSSVVYPERDAERCPECGAQIAPPATPQQPRQAKEAGQ